MKKILLASAAVFAVFTTVTFTSCKENYCKGTVCAYGGTCNEEDGSCSCQTGYEGERCETETRSKFKGAWRIIEDGTNSNPATYSVSVEDGKAINEVVIRNFYNKFNPLVTATVKDDTIYIAPQVIKVNEIDYTIEGKGYAVPEAFYDLHGRLVLAYRVSASDGSVNEFDMNGATNHSIWTK